MQPSFQDKDQWSAHAELYAKGRTHLSNAPIEILFAQMNHSRPFSTSRAILDVGSGPAVTIGQLIQSYGSQFPSSTRLVASDFSFGMIEQINKLQKEEQKKNPIWSRVVAKVLDAQVLNGVEDASISHITGTMVYNLVANGRQALEAAYRVIEPEGVIGLTLGASAEWMELMAIAAKQIRGEAAPTYQFPKAYGTVEGIRAEFEAVGFRVDYVETVEFFMDVSDPKPLVNNFIRAKNPGAMFFINDYSNAELDVFVDEVLRLIEQSHPKLPRKLKGVMIIAVGKKLN